MSGDHSFAEVDHALSVNSIEIDFKKIEGLSQDD